LRKSKKGRPLGAQSAVCKVPGVARAADASRRVKQRAADPSPWRRLSVDVTASVADAMSGLLLDEGALGLETEDDETRAVPGRASAPTGRASITATFSRAPGLEARVMRSIVQLAGHVPWAADVEASWTDLFAEDWHAIFQQQWAPFRCGARVWVCPSWERATFLAERVGGGSSPIVLYLDAGMAFGTGTHETTQLCIEALEQAPGRQVLDVGTGTGILSIAALKLGATKARGTDIDPVAVAVAVTNAKDNAVDDRFSADARAPNAGSTYDTIVANILAGTLIEIADAIVSALARPGRLFLSGVLVEQERAVRAAFVQRGLVHEGTATKNGWVRIDLTAQ
jgi:ribosomal protein L11 methyltransferase